MLPEKEGSQPRRFRYEVGYLLFVSCAKKLVSYTKKLVSCAKKTVSCAKKTVSCAKKTVSCAKKKQGACAFGHTLLCVSCGGPTRTGDLQVMSLASYQLLHSAMYIKNDRFYRWLASAKVRRIRATRKFFSHKTSFFITFHYF